MCEDNQTTYNMDLWEGLASKVLVDKHQEASVGHSLPHGAGHHL